MAIQLQREIGESGLTANHWVLVTMHAHRVGTTNSFDLSGTYALWVSAAAYGSAKKPIQSGVQVRAGVLQGNLTAGQMQAALDAVAVAQGGPLEGGVIV